MLKSNCKVVKERIKDYVINNFDNSYMENPVETTDFVEISQIIFDDFIRVMSPDLKHGFFKTYQDAFVWYCGTLPGILNTDFVYYGTSVDLLGDWLEETEYEKSKYTTDQAEKMICMLLYREISKVAKF